MRLHLFPASSPIFFPEIWLDDFQVTILESLIEGMFWQETLVGPPGYLDPYLKGVVNVSACWRQTHGNWHRVAAQMMKELMEFITTVLW